MTMHPKPKSAPGRMSSKFTSSKSNAMKEMEAWAKKDADPLGTSHEASRMSGQLVDNVTEERMLKAKLWELSKERYKFLSQNAYEKKLFVDRMQRKSSTIKRMLATGSDSCSRRSSIENSSSSVSSYRVGKPKRSNARQAFLDRMDPKKAMDRPRELKEYEKSVKFIPNLVTESASIATYKSSDSIRDYSDGGRSIGPKLPIVVNTASAVSVASSIMLETVGKDTADGLKDWHRKRPSRRHDSHENFTRDPRYKQLEHALTPVKDYQTSCNVKDVVGRMECLHLPPKRPKESKPKREMKVMEFMKERGFVF